MPTRTTRAWRCDLPSLIRSHDWCRYLPIVSTLIRIVRTCVHATSEITRSEYQPWRIDRPLPLFGSPCRLDGVTCRSFCPLHHMLVRFRCSRGSPVGLSFAHERLVLLLRPSGHPDGRMRSSSCRTGRTVERCDLRRHVPLRRVAEAELPRLAAAPRVHRARPARRAAQRVAVLLLRVRRAPCGAAEPRRAARARRVWCGVYISCGAMRSESRVRSGCAKCGQEHGHSHSGYAWVPPCLYNWVRRLRRFKTGGLTGRLRRCGTPPARRRTQPAACNLQQTTGLCAAGSA